MTERHHSTRSGPEPEFEHVVAGLAAALRVGAMTADAVALEARKAAQAELEPTPAADQMASGKPSATVTSLHEWRLAHLPTDTRPLPSVAPYDQLLRRRRTSGNDHREEKPSDSAPPARLDRAGRRRRHRQRLSAAAAAVDPQRVLRHRRPGDQGPADLPRFSRRAVDGRVRRPFPSPLGTTDQGGWLPAGEVAAGVRLRRQPEHRRGDHPHSCQLRVDQEESAALPDRRLRHPASPTCSSPWAPRPR